ncbi:MAG: hypothetical protein NZ534_02725 [Bacteroidia bacterium]|nr:hypothetical protein [Bacteroidia bacterium]
MEPKPAPAPEPKAQNPAPKPPPAPKPVVDARVARRLIKAADDAAALKKRLAEAEAWIQKKQAEERKAKTEALELSEIEKFVKSRRLPPEKINVVRRELRSALREKGYRVDVDGGKLAVFDSQGRRLAAPFSSFIENAAKTKFPQVEPPKATGGGEKTTFAAPEQAPKKDSFVAAIKKDLEKSGLDVYFAK